MGLSITIMLSLYLDCTCWQKCPSVSLFSSNDYSVNEFPSFSSASLPLFYINKISLRDLQFAYIIISIYAHQTENVHSLSAYQSNLFTNIAHKIQSHFSNYLIAVLATKFDLFIHYKYTIRIITLPMCKVALFSVKT